MSTLRRRVERLEKRQREALDAEIRVLMPLPYPPEVVVEVVEAIRAEHTLCPACDRK